jgi:deazaflavin-dependent oxidoreductase (nitroreductase family)
MSKKQNKSDGATSLLSQLADVDYCYVTTTGRVTGKPHEIEIWFGMIGDTIYLLSGGGDKSDWVKNMRAQPKVKVKIGKKNFKGQVRFELEAEEETQVRELLAGKYQGWRKGRRLSEWARSALPVAIALSDSAGG